MVDKMTKGTIWFWIVFMIIFCGFMFGATATIMYDYLSMMVQLCF